MIVYKAVRRHPIDGLRSYLLRSYETGCVSYEIGRRTLRLRGCGPLAAFLTESYLVMFLWSLDNHAGEAVDDHTRILCVEASQSEDSEMWRRVPGLSCLATDLRSRGIPPGTVLCDSIMPVEDITDRFMHEYSLRRAGSYAGPDYP